MCSCNPGPERESGALGPALLSRVAPHPVEPHLLVSRLERIRSIASVLCGVGGVLGPDTKAEMGQLGLTSQLPAIGVLAAVDSDCDLVHVAIPFGARRGGWDRSPTPSDLERLQDVGARLGRLSGQLLVSSFHTGDLPHGARELFVFCHLLQKASMKGVPIALLIGAGTIGNHHLNHGARQSGLIPAGTRFASPVYPSPALDQSQAVLNRAYLFLRSPAFLAVPDGAGLIGHQGAEPKQRAHESGAAGIEGNGLTADFGGRREVDGRASGDIHVTDRARLLEVFDDRAGGVQQVVLGDTLFLGFLIYVRHWTLPFRTDSCIATVALR